jgi:hypothetical protein
MGFLIILGTLKSELILESNSITLKGIRKNKTLHREEIIAQQPFTGGGVNYITLYPRTRNQNKIMISLWYDHNQEIRNWVSNIPAISPEHHPESMNWIFRIKEKIRRRVK